MRNAASSIGMLVLVIALGCTTTSPVIQDSASEDVIGRSEANLLLAEWVGPYSGLPAFDRMELKDLKAALEVGMERSLAEIDVIATNPETPTFENTIVEMQRTGKALDRVFTYYGTWSSNMNSPEFREIQTAMTPRISDYNSKISQNSALFARIKAVYEGPEYKTLRPDQQRMTWLSYNGFTRGGATLTGQAKQRYAEINKRLAELTTRFANNVLHDEESYVTYISKDQLSGLPEAFVRSAAAAAAQREREGMYAITNTRSSMDPFFTFSDERALREQVWRTYYARGDNGDEHDNKALIPEILALRKERVALLGYDNYADWRLEAQMAKNPANVMNLLETVWEASVARVHEEVADMQAVADAESTGITIAPWDYRYYAEKVRRARYDLDSDEVKQYMQLHKLVDAMHMVASEVFRLNFAPVPDGTVPVFHPDVEVFEVTDRDTGAHVGLWYLDAFARQGKRSGAWATTYRSHSTFDGKQNVLGSNNSNFIKGEPGKPVLVSWSDAETLFHEFGHALHYFSSNVEYPSQNGGIRDYTEFQSQLLEHWLTTDRVIEKYLVHHETGAPIPAELVAKIKNASAFNQGFETTEYLASALMDMIYHTTDPSGLDVGTFEREKLRELNMPDEVVMRHRSPHFGHVFSGEGYSASYYGYMWADVLTSDAAEAFRKAPGGFYDEELSAKMVKHLFAPRNAVDPAEAYRAFRGRDADVGALMRDRGFPIPKE
ncbi:MAG TPA: M3 family metallopeptidase [Thermoanaerobaculia bacterium]